VRRCWDSSQSSSSSGGNSRAVGRAKGVWAVREEMASMKGSADAIRRRLERSPWSNSGVSSGGSIDL
jgi:hypothetical protein